MPRRLVALAVILLSLSTFIHAEEPFTFTGHVVNDTVTLPSCVPADAAVFFSLTGRLRLQMTVENIFDMTYYINADSNTNISPGSPRAVRVALTTRF